MTGPRRSGSQPKGRPGPRLSGRDSAFAKRRGGAPPSRLDRLAGLLVTVSGFSQPLDTLLSTFFRSHPSLGPRERSFLAEATYSAVRSWSAFDKILGETGFVSGGPSTDRRRALMAAAVSSGYDRIVSELSEGERAWLTECLRRRDSLEPASARLSVPQWIWSDWEDQLGLAETLALAQAMDRPAELFVRANVLKTTPEALMSDLKEAGIRARISETVPECLELEGKPPLSRLAPFVRGDFEVQDLGSQLLARLAAPKRGGFVVDFCAGAGGKTLALGALMRNTGRLYAMDRSAARLARLKPRLARSGLSNVWPIGISGARDERLLRLSGKADLVLVDAPCTGLGTLRRNPDLKWRQTPQSLSEMQTLQASIMDSAARLCAPGGRLVYATCSTSPLENEVQVNAFLGRHPDFERLSAQSELARAGIECPASWRAFTPEGDLRLWPHRTPADGFFGSVLRRKMLIRGKMGSDNEVTTHALEGPLEE